MGVAAGCCRKDEKTMQILTISEKKKSQFPAVFLRTCDDERHCRRGRSAPASIFSLDIGSSNNEVDANRKTNGELHDRRISVLYLRNLEKVLRAAKG